MNQHPSGMDVDNNSQTSSLESGEINNLNNGPLSPNNTEGHGSNSNGPLSTINGEGYGNNTNFGPLSERYGSNNLNNIEYSTDSSTGLNGNDQMLMWKKIQDLKTRLYTNSRSSLLNPSDPVAREQAEKDFNQLETMEKYYKFLFPKVQVVNETNSNESNLVPADTPFFQWKGHTFMAKKFIFSNIDACLTQFENVLESRAMNIERHWKRIIKARMSTGMANWAKEIIAQNPTITFNEFKTLLKSRYSCSEAEERKAAVNRLKTLKLAKFESIEEFLEKFMELKEQSGLVEDTLLVDYLLKGLSYEMYGQVNLLISASRDKDRHTLDAAVSYVRSVYELYERDPHFKNEKDRKINEMRDQVVQEVLAASNRSNNRRAYPRNNNNQSDGFSGSNENRFGQSNRNPNYRGTQQRNGYQLNAMNERRNPYPPREANNSCYDCGFVPFTRAHKFECPGRPTFNNPGRQQYNRAEKDIVPKPVFAKRSLKKQEDTDSENEESHQQFASLNLNNGHHEEHENDMDTDCKSPIDFSVMPKQSSMSANHPLYLPIILEYNGIRIRTWFLLDTGCSFSAISPVLAEHLKVDIINKKGIIKLAQQNNIVKRQGCTEHKITINYGKQVTQSQFEIFDLFDDVHCVIGMNLLSKIGITIGNIVTDWSDQIGYEIPEVDPSPYKPNETPFGTPEQRIAMLKQLELSIEANKNISPKAYCTIPDSEISLPIRTDTQVNTHRRQFPIAEALRPIVQAQVDKWRDNGIIKPAEPGTPHNSPIFPVRKKNPQGEYAGDYRVVIDCRLINAALDPARIERFPLPLISELHKKMSKHSLYTVVDLSQCFHSFKIKRESRPYLTFTDMNGFTWSFAHCPFGITMISSICQRILSILFEDLKDMVTHFIDDVTIHTENDLQKHTEVVKIVLDRLTKVNLRVNTEKMHFAQKSVFILGFCMSEKGLALDPRKVSNILDWTPTVANTRELSSRLGLINFFRSHLPNLSTLTAPLDKLRNSKNLKAEWTQEHSNIMIKLQQLLVSAPILSTPNLKYDMCLVTDSSAFGIGAALYQVINNRVYYLGFIARRLAPSETRWGSSKRELAAVAYAFQRFHQWLYGRRFHLFVDNTGLLYLHSKEKINRMVENFYDTIFRMDFDITYCMGMKNILADQLSRIFWPDSLVEGGKQPLLIHAKQKPENTNNEETEKNEKQKRKAKEVSNPSHKKQKHKAESTESHIEAQGQLNEHKQRKDTQNNLQKGKEQTIKEMTKGIPKERNHIFSACGKVKPKEWIVKDIIKDKKTTNTETLNINNTNETLRNELNKESSTAAIKKLPEMDKLNGITRKEFRDLIDKLGHNNNLEKINYTDSITKTDKQTNPTQVRNMHEVNENNETNAPHKTDDKNDTGHTEKNSINNIPHRKSSHAENLYIPDLDNYPDLELDDHQLNINTQNILDINEALSSISSSNYSSTSNHNMYICASRLDTYQTPKNEEEKQDILEKSHLLGHFGIHAMEAVIHQDLNYHWKGMREDITNYIRKCHKCQKFNLAKHVYHPPKQETPEGIFDHIVFDLGTFDCTTPRGNNFMLVVMDLFSRFIILRAIPDKTAVTIAKELVSIFSLFGYPRIVGHDNGREFTSILLENILKHAGVENRASLPFSPQGNGCCEAAVKTSKTIIMKMLEGRREDWDLYIDGTALCLNIHRTRLHGMRPFTVMFHREPNEFKDYTHLTPVLPEQDIDVEAFKQKLDMIDRIIVPAIRDQIMKTQKKDSTYFRKRHRILENPYPIGATVMIKNIENKNNKTDPNYEGPFYIHGHTRNGSYILVDKTNTFLARDVPTQQLKLVSTDKIDQTDDTNVYEVEAILKHKGSAPNYQYLTRWKGYNAGHDTWEPSDSFDSVEPIKAYWNRFNAANANTKHTVAPRALRTRRIPTREDRSRNRRARLDAP